MAMDKPWISGMHAEDMFFFPDEVCPVFHGFLIGGVEHFFPYIGNSQVNPTDEHIFQRGRSTTNQIYWLVVSNIFYFP